LDKEIAMTTTPGYTVEALLQATRMELIEMFRDPLGLPTGDPKSSAHDMEQRILARAAELTQVTAQSVERASPAKDGGEQFPFFDELVSVLRWYADGSTDMGSRARDALADVDSQLLAAEAAKPKVSGTGKMGAPHKGDCTCRQCTDRKIAHIEEYAMLATELRCNGIRADLERMIASAEVFVDNDDVITGYKVKTGALHRLFGKFAQWGNPLVIPSNLPLASKMPPPFPPRPEGAFITSVSGNGDDPYVKVRFKTLHEMQDWHEVLIKGVISSQMPVTQLAESSPSPQVVAYRVREPKRVWSDWRNMPVDKDDFALIKTGEYEVEYAYSFPLASQMRPQSAVQGVEPVAWRWWQLMHDSMGGWERKHESSRPPVYVKPEDIRDLEPLYAAPQPPQGEGNE